MFRMIQILSAVLATVLSCLGLTASAAQTIDPPQVEWEQFYGESNSISYGCDVLATDDGGYVIVGSIELDVEIRPITYADVYLVKIDGAGRLQWWRNYGRRDRTEVGASIMETADGAYLIAGTATTYSSTGDITDSALLLRVSAQGDLLWEHTFGSFGATWGSQLSDGGYIVGGNPSQAPGLARADVRGELVWERSYPQLNHGWGSTTVLAPPDGYVIVGTKEEGTADSPLLRPSLLKVDDRGEVVWQRVYPVAGSERGFGSAIRRTSDGGYVVAGWAGTFPLLAKTDADGNLSWLNTYENECLAPHLSSISQTSDGGYVATGQAVSRLHENCPNLRPRLYAFRADSSGQLRWQEAYGPYSSAGRAILQTAEGGYLVIGGAPNPIHARWPWMYVIKLTPESLPQPPSDLDVSYSAINGSVGLVWRLSSSSNISRYDVEWKVGCHGWELRDSVPGDANVFEDQFVPDGQYLCYRVFAVNDAGRSRPSNVDCVLTLSPDRVQLKIYDPTAPNPNSVEPGAWVDMVPCHPKFDEDRGTAVIVHGWTGLGGDQLNRWMRTMAQLIYNQVRPGVNVLAWEWVEEARHLFFNPLASENINPQGEYLVRALESIYPVDYRGPVHLIGHSFGSRLILIAAQSMGLHDPRVPNVFPPGQVTLLDTPDRAITRGNIVDNINTVRGMGVYVDSYYGCTNDGPYAAHVWVDVPCPSFGQCGIPFISQCHSETHEWYRGTAQEDPILRDGPSCGNNPLGGTVGFGLSILMTDPGNPNRFRPSYQGCGLEVGTLKFSELSGCTHASSIGVFGLDGIQECEAVDPPQAVSRPVFSFGEFSDNCQLCELQTPESFFLSTGVRLPGEGGGGQVDEIVVSFLLPLTISDEWDYFSFEYDFTEMVAQATLEVTLTIGDAVYPVFLMTAEPVFEKNFLSTGLRDIRDLHGQSASLVFELRSSQAGAVVHVRDLTFWRDPWHGNHAPVADAGPDQDVTATVSGLAQVQLDGSGSTDADGDDLTYRWMIGGELLTTGEIALVEFSTGRYPVLLVVRDPAANVSTDEVVITVTGGLTLLRGDSNNDGTVDISDAINTLGYLFTGTGEVTCQDAADANDDGEVDISDVIFTLGYLFLGTPPTLPQPHPSRGHDPTIDGIGCDSYAP